MEPAIKHTTDKGSYVDGSQVPGDAWGPSEWDARTLGLAQVRLPNGEQYALGRSLRPMRGNVKGEVIYRYWVWKTGRKQHDSFKCATEAMASIAERMEQVLAEY